MTNNKKQKHCKICFKESKKIYCEDCKKLNRRFFSHDGSYLSLKQIAQISKKRIRPKSTSEVIKWFLNHENEYPETITSNNDTNVLLKKNKICRICSKPFKDKTHCCIACRKLQMDVTKLIKDSRTTEYFSKNAPYINQKHYKFSRSRLKFLCTNVINSFESHIVLEWFKIHIYDHWTFIPYGSNRTILQDYKNNAYNQRKNYSTEIPNNVNIKKEYPYIINEFKKNLHKNKKLVGLRGTIGEPLVIFQCLGCSEEFSCSYSDFKYGKSTHYCQSIMSSGEVYISSLLKKSNIPYITQRDALVCINPRTGHALPYDFELLNKKIIIEVQGDQHRKYIPYFHQTVENFKYQKEKDFFKKKFAEKNGYKYIEIYYKQFKKPNFEVNFINFLQNY